MCYYHFIFYILYNQIPPLKFWIMLRVYFCFSKFILMLSTLLLISLQQKISYQDISIISFWLQDFNVDTFAFNKFVPLDIPFWKYFIQFFLASQLYRPSNQILFLMDASIVVATRLIAVNPRLFHSTSETPSFSSYFLPYFAIINFHFPQNICRLVFLD